MRIYLDMDGTIANLYNGTWLEDILAENTRPYDNAERLVEEETLLELISLGYELGIISWTARDGSAEYNRAVRNAKREWLTRNYPNIHFTEIHIVKYGTPKYRVANELGILVDDEAPNREVWRGLALAPNEIF